MRIDMQTRDFPLTEILRAYIERRISFALSSRFAQIRGIRVRLWDINGPRGGVDKRCQIHITLPRLSDVVIEDTEADLYVAIDRAIDRAGRTVHRRLARRFDKRRKLFIPRQETDFSLVHNP